MPTVSIQYEVQQDLPEQGVVRVQMQVLSAENIDLEIFVHDVQYGAFTGVATLYDMTNFPRTKAEAVAAGLSYFRALGTIHLFDDVSIAEQFVAVTKSRIETLRQDWQVYLDRFTTTQIITTPEA